MRGNTLSNEASAATKEPPQEKEGFGLRGSAFQAAVERPWWRRPAQPCIRPNLIRRTPLTSAIDQRHYIRMDNAQRERLRVGATGEDLAANYLREQGYTVLQRNVRLGREEIDIIAHDPRDDVLVFVEVKSRSKPAQDGFHPEWTAGKRKRMALRRAVRRWVAHHDYDGGYRIDLICIENGSMTAHFVEIGCS
jgi:putative endonuclease